MECLAELQGQAADLNLLQEKIATSSDASQMDSELQSLLVQNEREAHEVEQVFDDIKAMKEKIAALERDVQTENDVAERFVTTLPMEEQIKFANLRSEQDQLAREAEVRATQAAELDNRARKLETELRTIPVYFDFYSLLKAIRN